MTTRFISTGSRCCTRTCTARPARSLAQTLGIGLGDGADLLLPQPAQAAREPLLFPASRWTLGSPDVGFVFDNERRPHTLQVPEYEIDAQPVSWAQFCEFVEDGGYDEARWWSPAGREWLQREQRRTPRHVSQMRHGVLQQRFGRSVRVPLGQPVVHVSFHEAQAWCEWAGRRLPSEVEWEQAAHRGASRGFRWGEVWEWTATTFQPYPGFEAHPYRDYSAAVVRHPPRAAWRFRRHPRAPARSEIPQLLPA